MPGAFEHNESSSLCNEAVDGRDMPDGWYNNDQRAGRNCSYNTSDVVTITKTPFPPLTLGTKALRIFVSFPRQS